MYDFLDKIGLKAVLEAVKGKMPTSLPANGGNADTVDGMHANNFITGETIQQRTTIDDCITGGAYAVSPVYTTDIPTQYGNWGICDVRVYGLGIFQTIKYTDTGNVICRSKIIGQTEWSKWKEISTTPIKSTTFGGTTGNSGNIALWSTSEKKIPMYIEIADCYAIPFLSSSDGGQYMAHAFDSNGDRSNTAVSGTVYYTEI